MTNYNELIARDLKHVWHPCAQMKDFETCPPLVIESAKGSMLHTNQGPLIDAISSWWCKSLGHGHPAVVSAIQKQLQNFEHVIAANTTHPNFVELAEELSAITGLQHVLFASDGASSVEIAMKLALHAHKIKGNPHKNHFIALKNSYHGETFGTLGVSDLGLYKAPYDIFNFPCHFIENIPYVNSPLETASKNHWELVLTELEPLREKTCALIVEPLIQGAAGMLCYSADFLKQLALWAKAHDIYLIADEIMTGIGRTGDWLASNHAQVKPDLICLSKGLTSGTVPLSCVMSDKAIFDLFYQDVTLGNTFWHSHTYSGNALAVSAALATIKTIKQEGLLEQAKTLGDTMLKHFKEVATLSGHLTNVRGLGAVVAADIINPNNHRVSQSIYQAALKRGALLRPIGNTLYWLPPLNTDNETIEQLAQITLHSINETIPKLKGYDDTGSTNKQYSL